ncbi:MAG TPA: hypothetical protein VJS37_05730, partial [Terriglobales bacterium]|nr:hypothetical protein [Terriglobales bacterium]
MAALLLSEAQGGGVGFCLIAILLTACYGFAGRWILLHPDKFFPRSVFANRDSFAARVARVEANLVGTFMVFSGAWAMVFSLAILVHLPWIGHPAGIACGVYAAIRIRKELHQPTANADQRVQSG